MPTKNSEADVLVDTSGVVGIVLEDHQHHASALRTIGDRTVGHAGHAAL